MKYRVTASSGVARAVSAGTTSTTPVLLSTRTRKGSTRFKGMSNARASALATAHSQPVPAAHHAARSLRRNCAARSRSQDSASRKYSSIAGGAMLMTLRRVDRLQMGVATNGGR